MASGVTTQRIGSREAILTIGHKPNATTATIVTPDQGTTKEVVDMSLFEVFFVSACNHTLTGNGITLIEIIATSDAAGSLNTQVVAASAALTGTSVGNGGTLEIEAAQVREVEAAAGLSPFTLRYVAGRITVQNSSDTCAVTYIRRPRHPQKNLSPITF